MGTVELLRATSVRPWFIAAGAVLVVGGAAAGLHAPISGADFWHLANAAVINRGGLGASATYLAHPGAPLDVRSWLADLFLLLVYRTEGLIGLELLGAAAGALIGAALFLAVSRGGRAHPLVMVVAAGLGILALTPVLTDFPSETLALLALVLLLALAAVRRQKRWAAVALVALVVVWSNTQADSVLAVLVIWGWVVFARWDAARAGHGPAPSWWLLPLTGAALLLNPRALGTFSNLPLSLGTRGEYPFLAAWSSVNFHPWSARLAELSGVVLLTAYWMAGHQLRRADAYLGLVTALLALLWVQYLPWFLVVAAVQGSWFLSAPVWSHLEGTPEMVDDRLLRPRVVAGLRAAAAVPVVIALGFLGHAAVQAQGGGGAAGQTARQLPVRATSWLAAHPSPGAWFTTPAFGDYLSDRFPDGAHLTCGDDPLPLAGLNLARCQQLMVLNTGALKVISELHVQLSVLPASSPQASFLLAEGWKIRYRDRSTVILAPSNL